MEGCFASFFATPRNEWSFIIRQVVVGENHTATAAHGEIIRRGGRTTKAEVLGNGSWRHEPGEEE